MEANVRALTQRAPGSRALACYDELGPLLTGRPDANAAAAIQWVHTICHDLAIPTLSQLGLAAEDIPSMADMARTSSSTKGNPIALTPDELVGVLEKAM
jgi:alcohol dehydrogenase class IV